jgi:hypothetical protein
MKTMLFLRMAVTSGVGATRQISDEKNDNNRKKLKKE